MMLGLDESASSSPLRFVPFQDFNVSSHCPDFRVWNGLYVSVLGVAYLIVCVLCVVHKRTDT